MNPTAILFIAFCAVIGHLLGNWVIGLAIGMGISLLCSAVLVMRK